MSPTYAHLTTRNASTEILVGGAQLLAATLTAPLARRWYNRWGATDTELHESLPGDDLVADPKLGYTRAITVDAPIEITWSWLVQFGQGRAGFYSYDALKNLVGCKIVSADRILEDHQTLGVGELIRSNPGDYPSWRVVETEPPNHLVLMGADPATGAAPPVVEQVPHRGYVGSTWQWILRPLSRERTRLIVRQRLTYSPRQTVLWHLVEPINFVMERAMLRGIARRAAGTENPREEADMEVTQ